MPASEAVPYELLRKRSKLAREMPHGASELHAVDLGEMLGPRDEIGQ